MAVEMVFDGPWIEVTFDGTITAADLSAVMHYAIDLERRVSPAPDRLVDLGPSTRLAIGFGDMANLVQMRRAIPLANSVRTAVVTHSSVQQGYARMFQTLNDHPLVTVQVFPRRAAAVAWLGQPR